MRPCQSIPRDLHLPTAQSAATKLAPDKRGRCRRKSNDDKTARWGISPIPASSVEWRYRPTAVRMQIGPVATVGGGTCLPSLAKHKL
jgi:hypothetical protein